MKKIILIFFTSISFDYAQSVTIDTKNTATDIIDTKYSTAGISVLKMTTDQKKTLSNKDEKNNDLFY